MDKIWAFDPGRGPPGNSGEGDDGEGRKWACGRGAPAATRRHCRYETSLAIMEVKRGVGSKKKKPFEWAKVERLWDTPLALVHCPLRHRPFCERMTSRGSPWRLATTKTRRRR